MKGSLASSVMRQESSVEREAWGEIASLCCAKLAMTPYLFELRVISLCSISTTGGCGLGVLRLA
jgi:hypothetical protein